MPTTYGKQVLSRVTGNDNPYYDFDGATCMAELIEHRDIGFNQGSILKAVLRWDEKPSLKYNLEKIKYYTERELQRLQRDGTCGVADEPSDEDGS